MDRTALSGGDKPLLSEFEPVHSNPFVGLIGPALVRQDGTKSLLRLQTEHRHSNASGNIHGGLIMSMLDKVMGDAARSASPGDKFVTVSFNVEFMRSTKYGAEIIFEAVVEKSGRSLAYISAKSLVDGITMAKATGVFSKVQPSASDLSTR